MADAGQISAHAEQPIYRIGRQPNPLDWAPWKFVGGERFDDPRPEKEYRVLYAGDRRACFLEVLPTRPDLTAARRAYPLTQTWIDWRRLIARFSLKDQDTLLPIAGLSGPETMQFFRKELADILIRHGHLKLDLHIAAKGAKTGTSHSGSDFGPLKMVAAASSTRPGSASDMASGPFQSAPNGPSYAECRRSSFDPNEQRLRCVRRLYACHCERDQILVSLSRIPRRN